MNDTWELWDHDKPCEHNAQGSVYRGGAFRDGAFRDPVGLWTCNIIGCPGGKKVVLQERWIDYGDEAEKLWEEAT